MCLSGNCSTCQRERAADRDRELEKAKSAKRAELAALTPEQRAAWEPETSGQIDRSETAPLNHIRRARDSRHSIADTFTKAVRDELAATQRHAHDCRADCFARGDLRRALFPGVRVMASLKQWAAAFFIGICLGAAILAGIWWAMESGA
ncbi:hypothetical protein ERN12_06040 [Rhodobacteraceae bacterium]|nr:hypothetical protein ERN12_06040 [Paracoccaceae bacterium]